MFGLGIALSEREKGEGTGGLLSESRTSRRMLSVKARRRTSMLKAQACGWSLTKLRTALAALRSCRWMWGWPVRGAPAPSASS